MAKRNYAGEAKWEAEKYTRLVAKLDKTLVEKFKAKLSEQNQAYAGWLRDHIMDYLDSD